MVLVHGGNTAIRVPYVPSQVTRYSGYPSAAAFIASHVLSVDVNAGEQGRQVGDLDVLE
jgi:hypothetical protein